MSCGKGSNALSCHKSVRCQWERIWRAARPWIGRQAAEYGSKGIRVNAVSPEPTRTEGTDAMGEDLEQLAAQAPADRPATADEIAEAIVFLATDRASFIYGAKLAVDGGRTAI
ncbi:MAG: SDR family oxidoreductase [Candidatus Sulfotelmatobacter sp.]